MYKECKRRYKDVKQLLEPVARPFFVFFILYYTLLYYTIPNYIKLDT